jgi:hypothetical protein
MGFIAFRLHLAKEIALRRDPENDLTQPTTPTGGEVFPDGGMLEFLYERQAKLLLWNGKKARIVERFRYGDQVFVPASIDSSTAQAIRFPAQVMSFGSTRLVFDAIRGARISTSACQTKICERCPTAF